MRKTALKYFIALLLTVLSFGNALEVTAMKWEPVKNERTDTKSVIKETELEIKTASSTIIVNSNHSVRIQIFTILGRLVSSETVPAGTSQLILPAHGVYLVKVGTLTVKVAV